MWLIISSQSPHSQHLQFCCVLSILALIWLVLMVLSCATVRRDSISLLRFPFLSQFHVSWCDMLFIRYLKQPSSCFSLPFLFPSCCHSFVYRVVRIVSDGCNKCSFVFFYVVFESLYGCVNSVFIIPREAITSMLAGGLLVESAGQQVSSQVSSAICSILADLRNAIVRIVSTRPLISKSWCSCTNSLVFVPSAPITTGITVTFMFHSFFNSLARSRY